MRTLVVFALVAVVSDLRVTIFEIMRAAPDVRRQAASDLGLIADNDLRGLMLDRHILDQAITTDRVADLERQIRG